MLFDFFIFFQICHPIGNPHVDPPMGGQQQDQETVKLPSLNLKAGSRAGWQQVPGGL